MVEDAINTLAWALITCVIILVVVLILRYLLRPRGEPLLKYLDPYQDEIVLDATGPGRRDKERIIEAGMILEDRRSGHDRTFPPVTLIVNREPQADLSARLNLRTVQKKGKPFGVNVEYRE